jgi:hypothetical protein
MGVQMHLNIRLARGVRSTPSGGFRRPRGVSDIHHDRHGGGDADCGVERGPNAERSSRSAASPRARPAGLHVGQPSARRDGGDVEPASIIDNLTRPLASPEPDPNGGTFDAFGADVTVDEAFPLNGWRQT